MRTPNASGPLFTLSAALGLLVMANAKAENSVVLESFESSIGNVTKGTPSEVSARIPDGVTLTQYSKAGDADPYVTDGSKSLRVDLTLDDGWGQDYTLTLSAEASTLLRDALLASDVARYILRYDVIFVPPPEGFGMNQEAHIGELNDEVNLRPGKNTMSVALDLLTGLSPEGQVVIPFADNFLSAEQPFVGPATLYVDNVRLVDTYVPGAVPVTYLLQSFEDGAHPTGDAEPVAGVGPVPRSTLSRYVAGGASDVRVSDGTHALRIDFSGAGYWDRDFRLPLTNTKLADVLRLDLPVQDRPGADRLGRYTLRFDVLFPDVAADWSGTWMKSSCYTPAQAFPYSRGRMAGSTGRRETISMTLDQVVWGEVAQGAPALIFAHSGAWGPAGTTLFYDNFRLIDTSSVALPSDPPIITSVQYDRNSGQISLAWRGTPGRTYNVEYETGPGSGYRVLFADVPCPQGQASVTGSTPRAETGLLRVSQKN